MKSPELCARRSDVPSRAANSEAIERTEILELIMKRPTTTATHKAVIHIYARFLELPLPRVAIVAGFRLALPTVELLSPAEPKKLAIFCQP